VGIIGRIFGIGRPTVSVLRLTGPIGVSGRFRPGITFSGVVSQIEAAFSVKGVKAVALVINSPGGSPVQSALIMQRVRDLAKEKDVPVLAFAEDVAASGGYMLALAGDEIFAHQASIIGSIGVIAAGFGFPQAIEKLGIERRLYTAGENKARLDPFSPERAEDVDWLLGLQGQIHDYFKGLVLRRRGKRLPEDGPDLFNGDVWLGEQAEELGLIDGIGDARTVLRQRFGKKVRLKSVSRKRSFMGGLLGSERSGGEEAPAAGDGWTEQALAAIEARLMWNRFGL